MPANYIPVALDIDAELQRSGSAAGSARTE